MQLTDPMAYATNLSNRIANNEKTDQTSNGKMYLVPMGHSVEIRLWENWAPLLPVLILTRWSYGESHIVCSTSRCVQPFRIFHLYVGSLSIVREAVGGFLVGSRAESSAAVRCNGGETSTSISTTSLDRTSFATAHIVGHAAPSR